MSLVKKCLYCGAEYSDATEVCPTDHHDLATLVVYAESPISPPQVSGRAPSGWVCFLYFILTIVANLTVVMNWPYVINTAFRAWQCFLFCVMPIFLGVYLPFRCRGSLSAWCVSGLATIAALFWSFVVVAGLLPVIF